MVAAAADTRYPVHFLDEKTLLPLCRGEIDRPTWNWTREERGVTCRKCKRLLARRRRS